MEAPKKRRWILPVVLVIIVAIGVGAYLAWPRGSEEATLPAAAGYNESFRAICAELADASSGLQASLLSFSPGDSTASAQIRALAGAISDNTAAARGLQPPSQKSNAHAALLEAAGYYDRGVQHALAAVGGGPGGDGSAAVFDATRELMQADRQRVNAEAALGRGMTGN